MNSQESVLTVEHTGHLATVTLNRPNSFNALSESLLAALQQTLDTIAADDDVHVVILAANGRAFCAGHDLKEMRNPPNDTPDLDYYRSLFATCGGVMKTIASMQQPVIAKVQGMATAAGCQLVGTCDLAVAADSATFAVSGINVGLFCSTPAVALSRNVSRKRAFEMLATGDFISAAQAADWGLINRSVPDETLDEATDALAQRLLEKSAVALRTGKKMFYQQLEQGLSGAYDYAGETMACNMMAEDTMAGIDAFIQKKTATWKHR